MLGTLRPHHHHLLIISQVIAGEAAVVVVVVCCRKARNYFCAHYRIPYLCAAGVGAVLAADRVKRISRTQDTPAHTVNYECTVCLCLYLRGQASDSMRYHRSVPPTRPSIPKPTTSKTCMSRLHECTHACCYRSSIHMRICMQASSCLICRIAPEAGRPHTCMYMYLSLVQEGTEVLLYTASGHDAIVCAADPQRTCICDYNVCRRKVALRFSRACIVHT